MLLAGTNGAPLLTPDDLAALLALADAVQVRRRDSATSDDDDEVGLEMTPTDAAENLAALLDAVAAKQVRPLKRGKIDTHQINQSNGFLNSISKHIVQHLK